ncbi:MAG: diguanylate cyclase domain-containing protein [Alcanivoracaceae bacterium]
MADKAQGQAKPRLIVVDDSKVMRSAATKMLGDRFDVVVAENGLEGWKQIRADNQIQVVFSDLSMPELDGYGLLEKIRTCDDPGVAGLPVIIVTGAENDEAAREKALNMGATDFITKPFNSTDLTARATAHANYQRERKVLAEQSTIDPLTGLGNQLYFNGRLKQELAFAARQGHSVSLVRADVDAFNKLFIKAGKDAADAVLKDIARVIAGLIRKEDTAARIGLNQFAVLLPTADAAGAAIFANRLCRLVRESSTDFKGHTFNVTLSIGVQCPEPHPGATPRSVIEEANVVLKAAADGGGNMVMTEAEMREKQTPLPSSPTPPATAGVRSAPINVEKALALLAEGNDDAVRPHLAALKARLMPLLKLMQEKS